MITLPSNKHIDAPLGDSISMPPLLKTALIETDIGATDPTHTAPTAADNPATTAAANATVAGAHNLLSLSKLSVQDIATIAVGLLLIAAGIFSFRQPREFIMGATKTAAKVAA